MTQDELTDGALARIADLERQLASAEHQQDLAIELLSQHAERLGKPLTKHNFPEVYCSAVAFEDEVHVVLKLYAEKLAAEKARADAAECDLEKERIKRKTAEYALHAEKPGVIQQLCERSAFVASIKSRAESAEADLAAKDLHINQLKGECGHLQADKLELQADLAVKDRRIAELEEWKAHALQVDLNRECQVLRERVEELESLLKDSEDGGEDFAKAAFCAETERNEAHVRIGRLEAALKPFAEWTLYENDGPNTPLAVRGAETRITARHVIAARDALKEAKPLTPRTANVQTGTVEFQ